jgi:hypothetical protein
MAGGLILFDGIGFSVGVPTTAKFVTVPLNVDTTVSERFVVAPAAILPRFVQMTWLLEFVIAEGTALTNAKPTGKLSVTEIDIPVEGPKFVTEIV